MGLNALILLSRTPHHLDTESWTERETRLASVSKNIVDAVDRATCHNGAPDLRETGLPCQVLWPLSRKSLAVLLVVNGEFESHFSHRIQDNQCRLEIGECDSIRVWNKSEQRAEYIQQSFSLWQLKTGYSDLSLPDKGLLESGRPGTIVAAQYAARKIISSYLLCKNLGGLFNHYTSGNSCQGVQGEKRLPLYEHLMSTSPRYLEKKTFTLRNKTSS